MMKLRTITAVVAALALVLAACGDSSDDLSDTTTAQYSTPPRIDAPGATEATQEALRSVTAAGDAAVEWESVAPGEPYDATFYDNYGVNPRIDPQQDALSTFAVDVDTGSYTIGRRYVRDGYLPDADSVRVEEYVNYFDMGYRPPENAPFAIHVDGGPTPFSESGEYRLVRVGLQSLTVADEDRKPANLTFVVDISGSMDRENRLGTVRKSLKRLVRNLRASDQVGIVVYGSTGQVLLEPTSAEERDAILAAIDRLTPGGSTNAEEGLILAYRMARQAFTEGAINRVILASDGVANVGNTGPDAILEQVREEAGDGIQLVTVGFGMGNYNDVLMERLADDGDGFYAYVDNLREADRLFVHDLTGTLQTVAKDAKVQVEFDPDRVVSYRLVGFENRDVADEDFRNDEVDAGEIGAGHSVTALYEVMLAPPAEGAFGEVRLRWQDPDSGEVSELKRPITTDDVATTYEGASPRFRLAATVAAYAEVLRGSPWAETVELGSIADEANRLADLLEDADVVEFAELAERAVSLSA